MYINKLLCLLLSIALAVTAHGQSETVNALDSFSAKLITGIRANEKQRAYLVTDRSVYKAGEYVWFRAFLLKAASLKPSHKSKFLFVDMVNEEDVVIKRSILDVTSEQYGYRMQLPPSLPTGYYWLRAYTKQMAESDTNEICVKPVYVVSSMGNVYRNNANPGDAGPEDVPVINFYPEGGNIMTGINSTVAVSASGQNGKPLSIEGYVKDSKGDTTTHFTTNASGLGKFDFEPSGYRRYTAIIPWKGKALSFPLPPFNFYSGQLSVSKENGMYKLRVVLGDSIYNKNKRSYITGISGDSLVYASVGKGQYEALVGGRTLPEGITGFYLFDEHFKLLSERSVYVNAGNVNVNITTDKPVYSRHDKVSVNVSATDVLQRAIPSLVAVSVSDSIFSNKLQPCSFGSIPGDLRRVDNLFLAGNNCFSDEDIDLVMLTKNDTYQALISNPVQPGYEDDDSLLYVKGTILSDKNDPLVNKVVTIVSKSDNPVFYRDTTDTAGRFCFPFESYPDSSEFFIEVKDIKKGSQKNRIVFDSIIYPSLSTPLALKHYPPLEPAPSKKRFQLYYQAQSLDDEEHPLPTVTVTDTVAADYDVSRRVSPLSSIIKGKDMDEKTSVDLAILRVSGLQVINGYLVVHGPNSMGPPGSGTEPIVLMDGVNVPVAGAGGVGTVSPVMSYLRTLNPRDIDFIEVLKGAEASSYGVRGGNGVILINTVHRRRDLALDKNNMQTYFGQGVLKPVPFPEPGYPKKNKKATVPGDYRSTIFWNGSLLTTDPGNSTIHFYTSDIPSVYTITVTGVTAHGDIIYKTMAVQSK